MSDNVKQVVPFFMVENLAHSVAFYVDGLGFRKTKEWAPEGQLRWCWLEIGQAAIMLQDYLPGQTPNVTRGLGVTISFQCDDALAIYHTAMASGLTPQKPFVGNGMWVVAIIDPDGYRVEFESPTDVPEGTEFAD